MNIRIGPGLSIADTEVVLSAIRSPGPGGQNVNKVATAVQLRFDIDASSLPEALKARLRALPDRRISRDGVVVIKAARTRSQETNRADAIERLVELIRRAAEKPRTRVPTKPGPGARRRRLEDKRKRAQTKQARGRPPTQD
jgi:ribosome-associated protein